MVESASLELYGVQPKLSFTFVATELILILLDEASLNVFLFCESNVIQCCNIFCGASVVSLTLSIALGRKEQSLCQAMQTVLPK